MVEILPMSHISRQPPAFKRRLLFTFVCIINYTCTTYSEFILHFFWKLQNSGKYFRGLHFFERTPKFDKWNGRWIQYYSIPVLIKHKKLMTLLSCQISILWLFICYLFLMNLTLNNHKIALKWVNFLVLYRII